MLANRLAATGAAVTVYDPQALPDAAAHLHRDVSVAESAERCVASSDIVVVTTPWPEFARIPSPFAPRRDRYVVIDCWRILDPEHTRESADLVYPGRMLEPGPIEASAAVMRSAAC
jgi:UDPglucose 6-dehydrogenase